MTKKFIRKVIIVKLVVFSIALLSIVAWEQVRQPVFNFFTGEEMSFVSPPEEATDYELFVAASSTQRQLQLMFEKHNIEMEQAELDAQQKAIEERKEKLREEELSLL